MAEGQQALVITLSFLTYWFPIFLVSTTFEVFEVLMVFEIFAILEIFKGHNFINSGNKWRIILPFISYLIVSVPP